MKTPLVSVITGTFNRAKYLEETILSIKNQDYLNIEHIIIDGGSTDGTVELLKYYENQYNMKWISEKDKGLPDALSKGFKMASGKYLYWLDSDDICLPKIIKKIVKIFEENPNTSLITGRWVSVSDKGVSLIRQPRDNINFKSLLNKGMCYFCTQATFFTHSIFNKIGGIDKDVGIVVDYDLWLRMFKENIHYMNIVAPVVIKRNHEESVTKTNLLYTIEESYKLSRKYGGKKYSPLYVAYLRQKHSKFFDNLKQKYPNIYSYIKKIIYIFIR